jgi:hypothetical protein
MRTSRIVVVVLIVEVVVSIVLAGVVFGAKQAPSPVKPLWGQLRPLSPAWMAAYPNERIENALTVHAIVYVDKKQELMEAAFEKQTQVLQALTQRVAELEAKLAPKSDVKADPNTQGKP